MYNFSLAKENDLTLCRTVPIQDVIDQFMTGSPFVDKDCPSSGCFKRRKRTTRISIGGSPALLYMPLYDAML